MSKQQKNDERELYVMARGSYTRREGGQRKTYELGDTVRLTAAEAERLGEHVAPAAGSSGALEVRTSVPPTPAPAEVVDGNVSEVVEAIDKIEADADLDRVEAEENERSGGARKMVLRAIDRRRTELAAANEDGGAP